MNLSVELLATWAGLIGLGLSVLKDKGTTEREYGRLEQKVQSLEQEIQNLGTLRNEVQTLSIGLARVETKLDAILTEISKQKNGVK